MHYKFSSLKLAHRAFTRPSPRFLPIQKLYFFLSFVFCSMGSQFISVVHFVEDISNFREGLVGANMRKSKTNHFLLLLCTLLFSGNSIEGFSYDYYATTECLDKPEAPQYRGGIIMNPEFSGGTKRGLLEERAPPLNTLSQQIYLEQDKFYVFSAWVKISEGIETVVAVFETPHGLRVHGGAVMARSGCWSMLKGGLVANFSSPAMLYFESNNTEAEIWVDSTSLQPFTKEQWSLHETESIEKIRKRKVRFQAIDANGTTLEGAHILINQTKSGFPFGCAMNNLILTNPSYQNWFTSKKFTVTAFTNEMKWYSTEKHQGQENYTIADEMLAFAKQNNIAIRGHNIVWDNPKYQPQWVKNLPPEKLKEAADQRVKSVVSRYQGEVIAWDVVNENLHFSFYEDNLGENASAVFFAKACQYDSKAIMFMNEYNTIEYKGDNLANPEKYLQKIRQIQAFPGNEDIVIGIGVQSRFSSGQPNIPYMKASLDKLGSTGFPIWLTEVDLEKHPNQAQYLEQILRVGFSHPAVEGIVIWSGPQVYGSDTMYLADYNFNNTPAGDVVDKLINEWRTGAVEATTDSNGYFESSLFHGDYDVTVTHPVTHSSATLGLEVSKEGPEETVTVQIHL